MVDIDALKRRFESLLPTMDERMRRLIAAAESLAIDYGGISTVSRATGVSRRAIARGIVELGNPPVPSGGAIRKPGGGRKRTVEQDATLVRDLERLIEPLAVVTRSLRCAGLARACANWPRNWAVVVTVSATDWWPSCCTSWAIACRQTPAVKLHHSLWSEGTGRGSGARAVVDQLGSSARRAPSRGSRGTDLLGSRAIGQLRPAFCGKSPRRCGF